MAGRKKLPDEIKRLKGTLQKCRTTEKQNTDGLIVTQNTLVVPSWLDREAKKIFKAKAGQLISIGVLTELDLGLLALYANSLSLIVDASKEIQKTGKVNTVYNDEGKIIAFLVNPMFKIMNDNMKIINQIGSQFGFSPTSRAAIMALATKKEGPKDDFADFDEM